MRPAGYPVDERDGRAILAAKPGVAVMVVDVDARNVLRGGDGGEKAVEQPGVAVGVRLRAIPAAEAELDIGEERMPADAGHLAHGGQRVERLLAAPGERIVRARGAGEAPVAMRVVWADVGGSVGVVAVEAIGGRADLGDVEVAGHQCAGGDRERRAAIHAERALARRAHARGGVGAACLDDQIGGAGGRTGGKDGSGELEEAATPQARARDLLLGRAMCARHVEVGSGAALTPRIVLGNGRLDGLLAHLSRLPVADPAHAPTSPDELHRAAPHARAAQRGYHRASYTGKLHRPNGLCRPLSNPSPRPCCARSHGDTAEAAAELRDLLTSERMERADRNAGAASAWPTAPAWASRHSYRPVSIARVTPRSCRCPP